MEGRLLALRERFHRFRRKFWLWVYTEAGKRVHALDADRFWDRHWNRVVAMRLKELAGAGDFGKSMLSVIVAREDFRIEDVMREFRDVSRDTRDPRGHVP